MEKTLMKGNEAIAEAAEKCIDTSCFKKRYKKYAFTRKNKYFIRGNVWCEF